MLHSHDTYRFYTMDENENVLHQAVYTLSERRYTQIGSIPVNTSEYLNGKILSMAYGEDTYWLYTLDKKNNLFKEAVFNC